MKIPLQPNPWLLGAFLIAGSWVIHATLIPEWTMLQIFLQMAVGASLHFTSMSLLALVLELVRRKHSA